MEANGQMKNAMLGELEIEFLPLDDDYERVIDDTLKNALRNTSVVNCRECGKQVSCFNSRGKKSHCYSIYKAKNGGFICRCLNCDNEDGEVMKGCSNFYGVVGDFDLDSATLADAWFDIHSKQQ